MSGFVLLTEDDPIYARRERMLERMTGSRARCRGWRHSRITCCHGTTLMPMRSARIVAI